MESLVNGPVWQGSGASSLGDQISCPDGWGKSVEVWADTGKQAVYCTRQVAQPMPTITVATGTDPLPSLQLGQSVPGFSLTTGANANAGAQLNCPAGSGPAVTGNGYSANKNEWVWSCVKSWVDASTVALATPTPTSTDALTNSSASATPAPVDVTTDPLALATVTISSRSLTVGTPVTLTAMKGNKVMKRWTVKVATSGKFAASIPATLKGARIVMTSNKKVIFNKIVK